MFGLFKTDYPNWQDEVVAAGSYANRVLVYVPLLNEEELGGLLIVAEHILNEFVAMDKMRIKSSKCYKQANILATLKPDFADHRLPPGTRNVYRSANFNLVRMLGHMQRLAALSDLGKAHCDLSVLTDVSDQVIAVIDKIRAGRSPGHKLNVMFEHRFVEERKADGVDELKARDEARDFIATCFGPETEPFKSESDVEELLPTALRVTEGTRC